MAGWPWLTQWRRGVVQETSGPGQYTAGAGENSRLHTAAAAAEQIKYFLPAATLLRFGQFRKYLLGFRPNI